MLADEHTGSVALCCHEVYKSPRLQPSQEKFLVRFQPKVLLLPSVTEVESGSLVSHCFVRCPAPNILNTSPMLLCTLHQDNVIRLWNIDDGRCISTSSPKLIPTNGVSLKSINGFPGHIFVYSESNQFWVVNVYTMQVVSQITT